MPPTSAVSRRPAPLRRAAGVLALAALPLTGCSPSSPPAGGDHPTAPATAPHGVRLPAADAVFDYQIGGPYPPARDVRVVSRDRTAPPAAGRYNVCYVNAFQAQPGDEATRWWTQHHPGLLLRGRDGEPVIDEDWNEPLLDISTAAKREELLGVVGPWIDGCAKAGFDAVEPDNLDSYQRSDGLLSEDDALAFAALLTRRAHDRGLAAAQKNTSDLLPERRRTGFDFAVTEECARYQECADYADAYGNRVFDIEYRRQDFATACRTWGDRLSFVLRDRDVGRPGDPGYVHAAC
ncbi:endo alpha-1,4 polygalactosaminidase [Streptomyces sp. RS10V-4]|uniref:endo alpha-1,4 polygalactosaminidase n=1 Tax=Streptomyces rhizoryzae TaxID=2932493 RepID=UPI0020059D35|nr:endo alpha-1,4 polygalactosaminidase [Streptomyces rhizoryzae]MCK7622478.1 endo alpha-1,4 polygalactosaminidase [Streptomyces rhizoryzae]